MPAYNQQEYDFIERTNKLIDQHFVEWEKYEKDLLINLFIGLLVGFQQNRFDTMTSEIITEIKWWIEAKRIIKSIRKWTKEIHDNWLNTIVRHLRNSISTYNFTITKDESDIISDIEFKDFANGKEIFTATLSMIEIRRFTYFFSSYLLAHMKESLVVVDEVIDTPSIRKSI